MLKLEENSMEREKPHHKKRPFAKLYIWIRDGFDTYKGKNPFKLLLNEIACSMWDFQEAKDFDMYFLNRRKTQINYISFPRYFIMSKFYKQEYTSQRGHRFAVYIPTKDLPKGLRIEIVMYNANDARSLPNLYLFPYKHKDRDGVDNNYDLIGRIELSDKRPETIEDIIPLEGYEVPVDVRNAVLQWAKESNNWETAKSNWRSCKKNFIQDVDVNTITNEQIIALFPSKAVREYLTKINWQFSNRDREILYRYLALNEEPAYEGDYVTIPFPFHSGDLVHVIGNEEQIGVFCSCKDDKDFFEHDKRIKDFADWSDSGSTRVEFLYPDGRFSHEHPYCFDLEPVAFPKDSIKGDPYKTALTIASELIRGTNSSIEYLQMYCEEYAEKNTKNHNRGRSRK